MISIYLKNILKWNQEFEKITILNMEVKSLNE